MTEIGQSVYQFIVESQRNQPQTGDGEVSALLTDIVRACKHIAHAVSRSHLMGLSGYAASENVQGETQKKLDITTNDLMIDQLKGSGHFAAMLSEEIEDVIQIPHRYPQGRYLICFDPLDGSSNCDINLSVGSIFSILRYHGDSDTPSLKDFMQPGTQQICAGFTVYGPATMLVLTTGNGVNGFTLNNDVGEFQLTHPSMQIPKDTAEFAINMSNQRYWQPPVQRYIAECIQGTDGVREKNFNMRWVASMVADVFRILTRGGIFLYPIDSKIAKQGGKLRLLYEANPMSFIVEQAGGMSSTGSQRIMEIKPTELHQRVPVILGAQHEVQRVIDYHTKVTQ